MCIIHTFAKLSEALTFSNFPFSSFFFEDAYSAVTQ